MKRLKAKRGVKRSQNTKIIHEATAGMETAYLASLTVWLERLKANNRALQELNVEIADHVSKQDLVAEYTTVTEYDNEAIRMMTLLDCKADSLRLQEASKAVDRQSKKNGDLMTSQLRYLLLREHKESHWTQIPGYRSSAWMNKCTALLILTLKKLEMVGSKQRP
ncbi:hypothetical protein HPB47_024494 [Ixodes persulcatus]|uniref:Uncharacterized protein n=1 Tax=Ixodes persulcatus TaxID=34615 RepID=A0AC60Q684_IXOPE|nr:hypothetical protein HPB47_024494 [Ixodes persulcatus]